MSMYYFLFDVRPTPAHPNFTKYGGALVACWIERDNQSQAEAIARTWIARENWAIIELSEAFPITRETQLPGGMRYFDQAEIDHEVFVFYTYPVGTEDDPGVA